MYLSCKAFVRFLQEILQNWYSVDLFPLKLCNSTPSVLGFAGSVQCRATCPWFEIDMCHEEQTGAACYVEKSDVILHPRQLVAS